MNKNRKKNSESLRQQWQKDVGSYLRELRVSAGVTQQNVSDSLGLMTGQYPSNVERGVSPPSIDYLKAMIELCKLDKEELANNLSKKYGAYISEVLKKKSGK